MRRHGSQYLSDSCPAHDCLCRSTDEPAITPTAPHAKAEGSAMTHRTQKQAPASTLISRLSSEQGKYRRRLDDPIDALVTLCTARHENR